MATRPSAVTHKRPDQNATCPCSNGTLDRGALHGTPAIKTMTPSNNSAVTNDHAPVGINAELSVKMPSLQVKTPHRPYGPRARMRSHPVLALIASECDPFQGKKQCRVNALTCTFPV